MTAIEQHNTEQFVAGIQSYMRDHQVCKNAECHSTGASITLSSDFQLNQYHISKLTFTNQVLKAVRQQHTEKLQSQLTSQGFMISFLLEHSMKSLNSLWSSAQSKLPKNIFNFSIRYLNNTLANRVNLNK